jgi:hypothetical protein
MISRFTKFPDGSCPALKAWWAPFETVFQMRLMRRRPHRLIKRTWLGGKAPDLIQVQGFERLTDRRRTLTRSHLAICASPPTAE